MTTGEGFATASTEQAQGIDQVNSAMGQMDKATQQNAANAEESASASEELSAQAEGLNDIIDQLAALVGGTSRKNNSGENRSHRDQAYASGRASRRSGRLAPSDQAWHQITGSEDRTSHSTTPNRTASHQTIPLDDDPGFDEFDG